MAQSLANGFTARLTQAIARVQETDARWRRVLLEDIAPRSHDVILDAAGCAGMLSVTLAKAAPGAIVMELDHRPEARAQARARAEASGVRIEFIPAHARDIASYVNELAPTRIICGFDRNIHDLHARHAILHAASEALRAGGAMHVIDREARAPAGAPAASPPHAPGRNQGMAELMRQHGFTGVMCLGLFASATGTHRLYRGTLATQR